MSIDETKQYYGPGGDFIPFLGVVYNDHPQFNEFFLNERVILTTSGFFKRPKVYEHGVLMGRITKFVLGIGHVETFIMEMPDCSREIVSRLDFTKEDIVQQVRLREEAMGVPKHLRKY